MEEELFEVKTEEAEETAEIPEKKKKSLKAELLDWGKTLLFYCLVPLLIFQSFCFMASVPTGSMETTIPVGAQVLTTRIFNKDNVERGDIIVFESEELGVVLIKRCLGLPGDKIVFDGTGRVFINDEIYRERYVSSRSDFEGEFVVPEDCYFFVGDNRAGSFDARYWETTYIHKDFVKGKGIFVLFPFSSFGILE
ncbi:MAG: signal peptidase I [Oscillospiraceae bacterium]|nr:signal peptidase I [Oscillospiraceae bacterium]MBR3962514.1 signal peptidase I [Oscillospiraceae bacterium]